MICKFGNLGFLLIFKNRWNRFPWITHEIFLRTKSRKTHPRAFKSYRVTVTITGVYFITCSSIDSGFASDEISISLLWDSIIEWNGFVSFWQQVSFSKIVSYLSFNLGYYSCIFDFDAVSLFKFCFHFFLANMFLSGFDGTATMFLLCHCLFGFNYN